MNQDDMRPRVSALRRSKLKVIPTPTGRSNTVRIAVVGLGVAGACMMTALNRQFAEATNVELALYDSCSPDLLWRGRAFQRDGDTIIANTPTQAMSLHPNDTSHARIWLENRGLLSQGLPDDHQAFIPRSHYGHYIAETTEQALVKMCARGWSVARIEEDATDIEASGRGFFLSTRSGRRAHFDYVVLCAGGNVLAGPWGNFSDEHVIANPYPTIQTLAPIPRSASVGILGSGLTAVDVAIALQTQGHQGAISMISRSGNLPRARKPGPQLNLRYLTMERVVERARHTGYLTIDNIQQLLTLEAHAVGGQPVLLLNEDPSTRSDDLRQQFSGPATPEDLGITVFQKCISSFVWHSMWYLLREEDKRALLTRGRLRAIMSRCCPLPPQNAQKILEMLDSGQLTMLIGTATTPPSAGHAPAVETIQGIKRFDYVVNAVTPSHYGVPPAATGLIDSAVRRGISSHHFAGGVFVERTTSAVYDSTGSANPRLYAIGDLTRGSFFLINGMPFLVSASAIVSTAIHAHMDPHMSLAVPSSTDDGASMLAS